ncbi:hypothetical protein ACLKA6_007928 [Drosophila palustris]
MSTAVQQSVENVLARGVTNRAMEKAASKSGRSYRLHKIYLVAASLIMFGLIQLMTIKGIDIKLVDSLPVPSLMWIVIALVCLLLMVFTELFNNFPINWTLGVVAVESVTLCTVCYKWNHLPVITAVAILISVICIHVMLYALGACLPLALLPGYYGMLYTTIAFIVVYIFLSIIIFALAKPDLKIIIDIWTFLYMIPLILYTATLIHHRRLPHMKSVEYILSATVIAIYFLFMVYLFTTGATYIYRLVGHTKFHYIPHKLKRN